MRCFTVRDCYPLLNHAQDLWLRLLVWRHGRRSAGENHTVLAVSFSHGRHEICIA